MVRKKTKQAGARPLANQLRIIGGRWRGRRISFPPLEVIRPSPDRVRETVFNWLQFQIPNARCLDLFAGSGALGLEALSRGAAEVVFVDKEPLIARHLQDTLRQLQSEAGRVLLMDSMKFLDSPSVAFDVVFLDPPFGRDYLPQVMNKLAAAGWLAPKAHVYMESEAEAGEPQLPSGWQLLRSKRAGQVGYHLAMRSSDAAHTDRTSLS